VDTDPFDALTARLSHHLSRRRCLGLLGVAILAPAHDAIAGKKKRKRRKKKKPTTPAAVARPDASCIVPDGNTGNGAGAARVAQTFQALRTGQMTNATVSLRVSGPGMDFGIEIWSVNEQDVPQTLLGGTTIRDVPSTGFPGPRPLAATFPNPVPVVAGTRYAIVVTKGDDADMVVASGNPCPNGKMFTQDKISDPFTPAPNVDMFFETIVVA
jgi:hypothetical protein